MGNQGSFPITSSHLLVFISISGTDVSRNLLFFYCDYIICLAFALVHAKPPLSPRLKMQKQDKFAPFITRKYYFVIFDRAGGVTKAELFVTILLSGFP